MNNMNVRLFKPKLGKDELNEIAKAFERSWVGLGPNVAQFEKEWTDFIGCKESIGLNSCTAALHLSLKCFNFPKGKKVLVPSMTFSATASAILYNDLTPVFVDSNEDTLGICIDDLKNKYDDDCVAVMIVHYAGHPVPMEKIMPWAKARNLKVIEDCAHTAGAIYKGKMLGNWGDISCFSFEEKKLMTTGDGGMICSSNKEILKDVRAYRWVGIDKDNWKTAKEYTGTDKDAMHWFYEISLLGYKYNMNDLAAAIGIIQLKKLAKMNQRRSEIIGRYMKGLGKLNVVRPLIPFEEKKYVYQMFGVRCEKRNELILYLKSKNIATGCHYTPLHMQPLFENYEGICPNVEAIYPEMITLPLHSDLTNQEIDYVLKAIKEFDDFN